MGQCTSSQAQSAEAVAERAAERQAAVEQQQRRRERQARAEASAARRLRETIIIEPGAAGRVGRGGSELDQPDDEGCTQLHRAAASGDAAAVRLLLDARASLHAVNGRGRTPLHCAAAAGHTDAIRLLAKAGAELERADAEGRTPLAVAAAAGEERAVRLLLVLGASPAAADAGQRTPLHLAALAPQASAASAAAAALLQAGAPMDAADAQGATALHLFAGRAGGISAVKALLDAGADPYLLDAAEQTPLGCALAAGERGRGAVELLLLAGQHPVRPGQRLAPAPSAPPLLSSRMVGRSFSVSPTLAAGGRALSASPSLPSRVAAARQLLSPGGSSGGSPVAASRPATDVDAASTPSPLPATSRHARMKST